MIASRPVFVALSCGLLLAACGDSPGPVAPPPAAPAASPPAEGSAVPPPAASSAAPQVGEGGRGVDSGATSPMEPMSKEKEVNSMPLAGQGNNHSSPSLDPTPGK